MPTHQTSQDDQDSRKRVRKPAIHQEVQGGSQPPYISPAPRAVTVTVAGSSTQYAISSKSSSRRQGEQYHTRSATQYHHAGPMTSTRTATVGDSDPTTATHTTHDSNNTRSTRQDRNYSVEHTRQSHGTTTDRASAQGQATEATRSRPRRERMEPTYHDAAPAQSARVQIHGSESQRSDKSSRYSASPLTFYDPKRASHVLTDTSSSTDPTRRGTTSVSDNRGRNTVYYDHTAESKTGKKTDANTMSELAHGLQGLSTSDQDRRSLSPDSFMTAFDGHGREYLPERRTDTRDQGKSRERAESSRTGEGSQGTLSGRSTAGTAGTEKRHKETVARDRVVDNQSDTGRHFGHSVHDRKTTHESERPTSSSKPSGRGKSQQSSNPGRRTEPPAS